MFNFFVICKLLLYITMKQTQGSLTSAIDNTLRDQNFMQKISVIPVFMVELYRVLISSFLILFVNKAWYSKRLLHTYIIIKYFLIFFIILV